MLGSEQRFGEGFARLDVDLLPVDPQPLPALGAVGAQFFFGEGRMQQNLFGYPERRTAELREGGEADVYEVAVEVHIEPRAVEVELFGYLVRRVVPRPFGQQVRRRRGAERHSLYGRSGPEYEGDAQHLEVVGRQQVERHAVGERQLLGTLYFDGGRDGQGRLCHLAR